MQRRAYGRDLGLTIRMIVSLVFLGLLYLPFVLGVLLWVYFLTGAWELTAATLIGLAVVGGFLPSFSERATLAAAGAKLVEPSERPDLHRLVELLSAMAELPKPRVAVVPTPVPNAFAAGRSPKNSVVAVTEGLLDRLEPQEVEAVVAHELAHIANRDALVMTLVSFPATLARRPLAWIARLPAEGPIGRRVISVLLMLYMLPALFMGWVAYAVATLLIMTISRYREYAGDRGAVLITGAPEQLQSALQKIAAAMPLIPKRDLRAVAGLNAFFVVPARNEGGRFALDPLEFFPTHPPLQRRLERLTAVAQILGRSVAADDPSRRPDAAPPARPERPPNEPAVLSLFSAGCYWLLVVGGLTLFRDASLGPIMLVSALALFAFGYGIVSALKGIGRAQAGASGMPYAVLSLTLLLGPYAVAVLGMVAVAGLSLADVGPLA